MNAPETGEDREALRSRERRQFVGVCICAAMFLLVLVAVINYVDRNAKEVVRISGYGASSLEIQRLKVKAVGVMNLGSSGIFVSFLGLVIFYVRWISTRDRRKKWAGLPPSE